MKFKTNFCERYFNLNPSVCFYDKDNVLVDSSHRARLDENGDFDLPAFDTWTVAPSIKKTLEDLRRGHSEDPYGWNIPV
mgnify:CR=1 FL=1